MIKKDTVIGILSGVFIISGVGMFAQFYFEDKAMQDAYREAVENSTIIVENQRQDVTSQVVSSSSLVELDNIIETVDEDQEIEVVKSYKNVVEVESLSIRAYIHEGVTKESLKGGVGWHETTVKPGEVGNATIAGHSSVTYNCIFNGLDTLKLWDTFNVYDEDGVKHVYTIVDRYITVPEHTSIINRGTYLDVSQITLYTCSDSGRNRLILIGREYNEEQLLTYQEELKSIQRAKLVAVNNNITGENITYELGKLGDLGYRHYRYEYPEISLFPVEEPIGNMIISTDLLERQEHVYENLGYFNYGIDFKHVEVYYDVSAD